MYRITIYHILQQGGIYEGVSEEINENVCDQEGGIARRLQRVSY
jgi:hypothetical protein